MTLIELALAWRKAREERLAADKQAAMLKDIENDLKAKLIERFKKSVNKSASNGERLFQLKQTKEPTVEDWNKVQAYVQQTGEFDLLQRRLNNASVKARWEDGKKIPGVGVAIAETISDTKAS